MPPSPSMEAALRRPEGVGAAGGIDSAQVSGILGRSAALRSAVELARRVAAHPATAVLLQGETGTGKELFARGIHNAGPNRGEPFVAINCAAIPESLLESELFGHERGAFTGAAQSKRGLFEFAAGGTVFLDEIGELPTALQPKLLRVLEERRVRPVGGLREQPVACRIVAATNRDLSRAVAAGEFREDLYYRLNVFRIALPALRERPEDVAVLAAAFLERMCRERGLPPKHLAGPTLTLLREHAWPGNVRELKNTVERALILAEGDLVLPEHIIVQQRSNVPALAAGEPGAAVLRIPPEGLTLEDAERELIRETLRLAGYNQSRAARMLGISRATILRKLRRYGLGRPDAATAQEPTDDPAAADARRSSTPLSLSS